MTTFNSAPTPATADIILLIHGLWMTPRSWEKWIKRYEERGYTVLAPSWPGMEGEVEALNHDPAAIAKLDVTQIVDYYATIIRDLPTPPIVMGHSLGGTITQLLLDRGLGVVGVGVASGTVKGVPDLPFPQSGPRSRFWEIRSIRVKQLRSVPTSSITRSPILSRKRIRTTSTIGTMSPAQTAFCSRWHSRVYTGTRRLR